DPELSLTPSVDAVFDRPLIGAPHAVAVEIGVVAEADAHCHEREGDRKAEKDDDNEDAQHQQGNLRVTHGCFLPWLPPSGWTMSIASEPWARTSCVDCSIS